MYIKYKFNMTGLETMMYAIKCMFLFGLAICYSAEGYGRLITGEVCLKTALQFPDKCSFLLKAAETYFKTDHETCQRKCSVTIYRPSGNMDPRYFYSLHTITVIFGDKSTQNYTCTRSSYAEESHLSINCSSWKQGDYLIGDSCKCDENGAFRAYIGNICICHCLPGHFMLNGRCLLANVHVGYPCSSDLQCTGTGNAGNCSNGVCHCQMGYLQIYGFCYQGVFLNQQCMHSYQCLASPYAACLGGRCKCIDGYKTRNNRYCKKRRHHMVESVLTVINVQIRQYVNPKDVHAIKDSYSSILIAMKSCVHHMQCSGSPYAACLNGKCDCISGYVTENSIDCVSGVHREVLDRHEDAPEFTSLSTLGILFGGFFLGAFITAGLVFFIYRRSKSREIRRTEPCIMFTQGEVNRIGPSSPQNTMPRAINVNIPQLEPPEYGIISYRHGEQLTNEDVYNHLNEVEEFDDNDNYDHACAAAFHMRESNPYSYVQRNIHIPISTSVNES